MKVARTVLRGGGDSNVSLLTRLASLEVNKGKTSAEQRRQTMSGKKKFKTVDEYIESQPEDTKRTLLASAAEIIKQQER